MIHVLAAIEVVPGRRAELIAEFGRVVPLVRAEAGCIEYGPAIDLPDTGIPAQQPVRENMLVVIEKWESLEALKAHLVAPHMLEYRTRVKHLIAGLQLQILKTPSAP
jgi:quinol monooxygenase YgiN